MGPRRWKGIPTTFWLRIRFNFLPNFPPKLKLVSTVCYPLGHATRNAHVFGMLSIFFFNKTVVSEHPICILQLRSWHIRNKPLFSKRERSCFEVDFPLTSSLPLTLLSSPWTINKSTEENYCIQTFAKLINQWQFTFSFLLARWAMRSYQR